MGSVLTMLLAAAESPGPRGDNPSDLGGILMIVGIAAVVMLAGIFAMYRRKRRV